MNFNHNNIQNERIKQKQADKHILLLQNSSEYNPAKEVAVACLNEAGSSNYNNKIFGDIPVVRNVYA